MGAAVVLSRLSLALGLSVAASAAAAFDSGSEPVYRLLPEIALAGADLPGSAPGFVTTDMQNGKTVLRWGQLFRIAGDPRVYGRFSDREVVLTETGDPAQQLSRSPNGHFLALMSSDSDAGVQIYPLSGEAPAGRIAASALSSAACGASDASAAEPRSARWADDYVLEVSWRVADGTAPERAIETVYQVMADGQPQLTSCRSVEVDSAVTTGHNPQRDVIARLRTLTFVRLPVMAEPSGGKRPSVLVSGPGPAFSALDAGDPVVRTALSGSQSYLQVVAAVPPQLAVAPRKIAAFVPQQPGIRAAAAFPAFGLRGNSGANGLRSRGGEGGSGSGSGSETGSGG